MGNTLATWVLIFNQEGHLPYVRQPTVVYIRLGPLLWVPDLANGFFKNGQL